MASPSIIRPPTRGIQVHGTRLFHPSVLQTLSAASGSLTAAPEACPVRTQATSLLEDSHALPTHDTLAEVTRQNLVAAGCEWQDL